jgi:hypothetical protein
MTFTSKRVWGAIFFICAVFQLYRKAPLDAFFFFIGFFLLLRKSPRSNDIFGFIKISNSLAKKFAMVAVIALIVIPVHNYYAGLATFLFLPLVFKLMSLDERDSPFIASNLLVRSAKAWGILALLTCIWELSMYFSADFTGEDSKFPTISDLVDPNLASYAGKLIFIIVWIFSGLQMMKSLEER